MTTTLSESLVIGISSTALFDLSTHDDFFRSAYNNGDRGTAVKKYRQHILQRENDILEDGTGMPLVKALLELNAYQHDPHSPLVEVVVMSRNSVETGVCVLNNIRERGLHITRHAFTGGEPVIDYLEAFDVDLFLTTQSKDAQKIIDSRSCAAAIVKAPPTAGSKVSEGQVRIAFDGDAILFSEDSEIVFKERGLQAFQENEDLNQKIPMPDGPYAALLRKLSSLQDRLPFSVEVSPVRIAIVTARSAPAEMRVINTLRHWGVYVDEIFFMGGVDKTKILEAFRPHIFFDDQDSHLSPISKIYPAGKVPYNSLSPLSGSAVDKEH